MERNQGGRISRSPSGSAQASPCAVCLAGTKFSLGGSGIQWENTGAGYLAFELFMRSFSNSSGLTSALDCATNSTHNATAETCLIAHTRDDLSSSMLSYFKARANLLQATGYEEYQGIAASLRLNGAPTGFGCAATPCV